VFWNLLDYFYRFGSDFGFLEANLGHKAEPNTPSVGNEGWEYHEEGVKD
jgi:hypothetical protein